MDIYRNNERTQQEIKISLGDTRGFLETLEKSKII